MKMTVARTGYICSIMKKVLSALIAFALPIVSLAHGYWMEVVGTGKVNTPAQIRLYFGEYVSGERLSGNFLDRMKEIKVFVQGKEVAMKQQNDYWEGEFTPNKEGSYTITAINNEREVQDWTKHDLGIVRPIQYLKTVYLVGTTYSPVWTDLFLDAVIRKEKDLTYIISINKNGSPFTEARITVTHPDGEETFHTGNNINFTAPKSGLYVIDIDWIDKTPGQFKGKQYASVRHKLDYSLYHK